MTEIRPLAVPENEAAKLLRVKPHEFRAWREDVDLEPVMIGGQPRYLTSEIEKRMRGIVENLEDCW